VRWSIYSAKYRTLRTLLHSQSATKMGELDVSMTTARLGRLGKECSFGGNGEGERVIESEDDGRRWEGGWRQRWSMLIRRRTRS